MEKIKTTNSSEDFLKKNEVFKKFWPIALLFFLVYIPVSFFVLKDYFGGCILLVTFLFFIISLLIYFKTKNVRIVCNMLALLGIPVLIPWLITGGPAGSGFWWSTVYVVWAFLVTSKRSAIFWLTTYFILVLIVIFFSQNGMIVIAYPVSELLNLSFAFVITFALVFLFDEVREYYFQLSKKKENELSNVNEHLISANAELEQFIYVASHDLQEPLRMIVSYLQLLEKKYKNNLDKDANDFINYAVEGSNRMRTLILSLLDYSHINNIRPFEEVNLNELLNEVLKDLSDQIKENKVNINIEPLPIIYGDKILLSQLFQNLIGNAIKFKKEKIPRITITSKENNYEYLFSISDNGIGIQKEYESKLFTIFQRLNSKEQYPGTGIGLVICKKIVEKHGGKIWFDSEFGKGTTFYFTLKGKPKQ